MPPDNFLSYFADPFSSADPLFALRSDAKPPRIVSHSELLETTGNVYTFGADRLVESLRLRKLAFPKLVDIGHALQLASGLPRREIDRSEWKASRWLRLTSLSQDERESYFQILDGEIRRPDSKSLDSLLLHFCKATAEVWHGISEELERLGELERFTKIEIPVQQLMHQRQAMGLVVDATKSRILLAKAKSEKYEAMLRVGATLNHNPTGLTYRSVLPFLSDTDASSLSAFSGSRSLPSYFKMAANTSHLARDFRALITANRNIKSLLTFATSEGRVFPTFDTMGTVTGRILTSSPNIQQLKRSYRGAIQADPGKQSAYLDFAQYEPGVLAQFVGPGRYRDMYNRGDVYTSLSEAVFKDPSKRDLSKQIFIAFCYGMELESMGRLLEGSSKPEKSAPYATLVGEFFRQFPELTSFKRKCEADLQSAGFIGTPLGNRRIRRCAGDLNRRERGWAMNQVVQGTASLIFKETLLSLSKRFGPESILMPIHDAVWLQVPAECMEPAEFHLAAANEMKAVFSKWCPDVTGKVKATAFDET
jgi:hypothetical protein